MAFLVRSIHVGSASFILGGAILLIIVFYVFRSEQAASTTVLIKLMQAYELGFWAAMGLIVATGIGNIAHFGEACRSPTRCGAAASSSSSAWSRFCSHSRRYECSPYIL